MLISFLFHFRTKIYIHSIGIEDGVVGENGRGSTDVEKCYFREEAENSILRYRE